MPKLLMGMIAFRRCDARLQFYETEVTLPSLYGAVAISAL
jgi:hypothetical protein